MHNYKSMNGRNKSRFLIFYNNFSKTLPMKLLLTVFVIICSTASHAQVLQIGDMYELPQEKLFKSAIVELDSLTAHEIMGKIKTWGQTGFNDLEVVTKGETDNQITFSFLTNYSYQAQAGILINDAYYVRMVVQIKDGRARALFFDDGNKFYPPVPGYSGAILARTWYLIDFFDGKPLTKVNNRRLLAFKVELDKFIAKFLEEMKLNSKNGILNQDW